MKAGGVHILTVRIAFYGGDEELRAAVEQEVDEELAACAVEFGGDVVHENDGLFAAFFRDELGLRQDEGADEGFLLSAREVVGGVLVFSGGDTPFGAMDAVAGVFELAVAFKVGVEEFGKRAFCRPAAIVADVQGFQSAEFGVVVVECFF